MNVQFSRLLWFEYLVTNVVLFANTKIFFPELPLAFRWHRLWKGLGPVLMPEGLYFWYIFWRLNGRDFLFWLKFYFGDLVSADHVWDDPVKSKILDPKHSKFLEKNSGATILFHWCPLTHIKGVTAISKHADYYLTGFHSTITCMHKIN